MYSSSMVAVLGVLLLVDVDSIDDFYWSLAAPVLQNVRWVVALQLGNSLYKENAYFVCVSGIWVMLMRAITPASAAVRA